MTSLVLRPLLLLAAVVLLHLASCCNFPSTLHMEAKDPPWYSHVRANGSRDVEYYIRHTVMEVHYPRSNRQSVRWTCALEFQGKFLLKRQDQLVNSYYRCVKFIFRSRSVVQIMWSEEFKTFDIGHCDNINLELDPWPLIGYGTLRHDYSPCPFSGGFDMKVVDSQLGENGCNLMLRPMRMEAECFGGEGVTFNFVSSNCLPDIKMYVRQQTVCVTDWQDSRNHYVILRRNEDTDLWCLVMPLHRGHNVTAYLFSDLTCRTDAGHLPSMKDTKFFTLHLHTRVFPTICEDEYEQCRKVTCNTYVKQECQRSCGMCSSESLPPACEYPRSFLGSWLLMDLYGLRNIDINPSNFTIDGVGSFLCAAYPNSLSRKSTVYTTISTFENGCRPRYTCVRFHRLGPSVLQYSISQSYVWPTFEKNLGNSICNDQRFHADSSPLDDRYRSHESTGKPIISRVSNPVSVHCNLSFVYTISATLQKGYVCPGILHKHCEDPSMLRLEFGTCGSLIPASRDYRCLANFQGHYWERILLAQNVHDAADAICFVFSQIYSFDAYVLVASQCDQKSFNFARSGLREPILKLKLKTEQETCKSVYTIPTSQGLDLAELSGMSSNSKSSMKDENRNSIRQANMTLEKSDTYDRLPGSHAVKMGHDPNTDQYNDERDSLEVPSAKSTSLNGANSLRSDEENSDARTVTYVSFWTLLFVAMSVVCSGVNFHLFQS